MNLTQMAISCQSDAGAAARGGVSSAGLGASLTAKCAGWLTAFPILRGTNSCTGQIASLLA